MNDPLKELEDELSRLRPRALSQEVSDRVAAQLTEGPARMSRGDRCLLAFMGSGALAASVIVGMIGWQLLVDRSRPVSSPSPAPTASIGEYQMALAGADGPARELLR